jgi:lipopolysaccharide export system protein LptC
LNTLAPLPPSSATARTRRWGRRWAWVWDQSSIYLPVLLMGALALGSYWVVRQTPSATEPPAERPASSEPDYTMRDFALRTFGVDGQLRTELTGREIRHYPQTDTTVVDDAQVREFGADGRLVTAQARELLTNSEQTEYRLKGDVRIVQGSQVSSPRSPRTEFQGQALTLYTDEDRVVSPEAVTLTRGADRLSADRMTYDQRTGLAQFQGRVRASLATRP